MSEDRIDWAWLAGIFEGEGTAALRFNKGRWANSPRRAYLYAAISQTNLEMLDEVPRIAGRGKIYISQPAKEKRKQQWAWYVACRNAREFLNQLLPHMRSPHKIAQVATALRDDEFARSEGTKIRRAILDKCREARWEKYRNAKISRTAITPRVSE